MRRKGGLGYNHCMPRRRLLLLLVVLLVPASGAHAQPPSTPDVIGLVRADRWAEAELAVAAYADPVARKLVTYYRLMTPNAADAADIAEFMATSPDWPQQSTLAARREAALANEPDDTVALKLCDATPQQTSAALLRCADAFRHAGRAAEADAAARRRWVTAPADAAAETLLLAHLGATLTGRDQWDRFEHLAWSDAAGAQRQATRLDPPDRARAAARLALKRDDPQAAALLAALPAKQRDSPGFMLDQARWLRRGDQDDAAMALWREAAAAERAATAEQRAAFWNERNLLARRRLRNGDPAGAYALAAGETSTAGEAHLDAEFLAGFIALRQLHDPAKAAPHFQSLAAISTAAITQGRAHYWLGRTAAAAGDPARANAEYTIAASWPGTYYGQLAALRLGLDLAAAITASRDPPADATRALDLAGRELARAAAYLVAWGAPRRAQPFLLRLDDIAPDGPDRALAARLAAGFGMPETAVAIARRAGRDGMTLLDAGWPIPVEPPGQPGMDPSLALGLMRQESSFDSTAISPVGARGLMQLMPGTAGAVARKLGLAPSLPAALVQDPGYNMLLGTSYLRDLLDQFGGAAPLAIASYNAGPSRVSEWLVSNGDPRGFGVDIVDWIELIPFSETRNYVQRVIESQVVYAAKRHDRAAHPMAAWLR